MHPSMSLMIVSIISWNVKGALVSSNGITVYSNKPFFAQKTVFHPSSTAIRIRLSPFLRSNLVNHLPSRVSSSSLLRSSRGYLLGIVRRLRSL